MEKRGDDAGGSGGVDVNAGADVGADSGGSGSVRDGARMGADSGRSADARAGDTGGNGSGGVRSGGAATGSSVTRRSVLVGVGILVVSLLAQAGVMIFGALRKGQTAHITDSDGVVRELPLDSAGRVEITTSLGSNTVEVADGQVRVVDATCKNKDCVHQGPISDPGQTIVCLPNRLVIRIEGSGSGDGNDPDGDGARDDVDAVSG